MPRSRSTSSGGFAAAMRGKGVRAGIEGFVDGTAYATLVSRRAAAEEPITAEGRAEKPTRRPPARKAAKAEGAAAEVVPEAEAVEATEPEESEESEEVADEPAGEPAVGVGEPKPKKKTRRGSRGGRGRNKKAQE